MEARLGHGQENDTNFIFEAEVPLSKLVDSYGTFLSPDSKVGIFANKSEKKEQFAIEFGKPLKSGDIKRFLRNFTDTPFSPNTVSGVWEGFDEGRVFLDNPTWGLIRLLQDQLPAFHSQEKELGRVLESPDDTDFLKVVARNIKSSTTAWNEIVGSEYLSKNIRTLLVSGKISDTFIPQAEQFLSLESDTNKLNARQRGELADSTIRGLFEDFENYQDFKSGIIEKMYDVGFSFSSPDSPDTIYYTRGSEKDIAIIPRTESLIPIVKLKTEKDQEPEAEFSADVEVEDDGTVIITPQQFDFVLPVLKYEKKESGRSLVMDGDVTPQDLRYPVGRNIFVEYGVVDSKVNFLAGLMVGYDLLMEQTASQQKKSKPRIPAETFPYAALESASKMLDRRFFANAERLVRH